MKKVDPKEISESTEYDNFIGKREKDYMPSTLAGFLGEDDPYEKPWEKHWQDMPEYKQEDKAPYKTIYVHFRTEEDYNEFAELIGQDLTEKTKTIWHPKLEVTKNYLMRWIEEE